MNCNQFAPLGAQTVTGYNQELVSLEGQFLSTSAAAGVGSLVGAAPPLVSGASQQGMPGVDIGNPIDFGGHIGAASSQWRIPSPGPIDAAAFRPAPPGEFKPPTDYLEMITYHMTPQHLQPAVQNFLAWRRSVQMPFLDCFGALQRILPIDSYNAIAQVLSGSFGSALPGSLTPGAAPSVLPLSTLTLPQSMDIYRPRVSTGTSPTGILAPTPAGLVGYGLVGNAAAAAAVHPPASFVNSASAALARNTLPAATTAAATPGWSAVNEGSATQPDEVDPVSGDAVRCYARLVRKRLARRHRRLLFQTPIRTPPDGTVAAAPWLFGVSDTRLAELCARLREESLRHGKALRGGNPLEVLTTIPGTLQVQRALHARRLRLRSEITAPRPTERSGTAAAVVRQISATREALDSHQCLRDIEDVVSRQATLINLHHLFIRQNVLQIADVEVDRLPSEFPLLPQAGGKPEGSQRSGVSGASTTASAVGSNNGASTSSLSATPLPIEVWRQFLKKAGFATDKDTPALQAVHEVAAAMVPQLFAGHNELSPKQEAAPALHDDLVVLSDAAAEHIAFALECALIRSFEILGHISYARRAKETGSSANTRPTDETHQMEPMTITLEDLERFFQAGEACRLFMLNAASNKAVIRAIRRQIYKQQVLCRTANAQQHAA